MGHDLQSERTQMAATIWDVARAAGVDISTVSRAFSNPGIVRAETRERVLAAAESLNYVPNRAARGLATGRMHALGLIVADIANPFFPPLIKSAQAAALKLEYGVYIADTDEDPNIEQRLVRNLEKQVDGLILASPRMSQRQIAAVRREISLVVVNRKVAGVPTVLMDVEAGTQSAIAHLADLGHRELCLLTGPAASWTSGRIAARAAQACKAAGLTLHVSGPNAPTREGGAAAARAVLHTGATAVLGYNDLVCIGLINELREMSIGVPHQISVVGFDDCGPASYAHPGITSVAMPSAFAGRVAVDMLIQLLAADSTESMTTMLPTRLTVRSSTAPPAIRTHRRRPRTQPAVAADPATEASA